MKVRLNIAAAGHESGAVVDLPDDEAAAYLAQGMASDLNDDHPDLRVETASVDAPENAAAPAARKAPAKRVRKAAEPQD